MFGRKKIAMMLAEFLGTGILTLVVLSVQRSQLGLPLFISLVAGLAVAMLMFVFGNVSGAHLNPAVTIGLWTARKVETLPAVMYVVLQLFGAWVAYNLYTYLVNSSFPAIGGHFAWRVLVAEGLGSLIFTFAWAAAAFRNLEGLNLSFVVGGAFTVALLIAATASLGIVNPALALGTRSWVWGTYVLGPVVGGIIGVNLYNYVFAFNESAAVPAKAKRKK